MMASASATSAAASRHAGHFAALLGLTAGNASVLLFRCTDIDAWESAAGTAVGVR